MTAQDAFKRMMSDSVIPLLRSHRYRGSGQRFWLPSESHHAGLGVQKRLGSTRQAVRFTANLVVVGRGEWEDFLIEHPYHPERPSPNTFAPPPAIWKRLGEVMPDGRDTWWTISEGDGEDQSASEFTEAIAAFAIPFIETHVGVEDR